MTLPQTIEKMRGAKGSKVRLTIVRADKAPVEVTIARDIIRVKSVKYHLDKDNIGYIRITRFQDDTAEELKRAVLDIKAKFAADQQKAFVLDLRNNPGGLLDQAVKVAGMFLEGGEVVSVRDRNNTEMQKYRALSGDVLGRSPLIVLINGGTAAGAEIVAGALQDQKRAKLVGTKSFGNGIQQTIFPLQNGGAIRIATARFLTPAGQTIDGQGIKPDSNVDQPTDGASTQAAFGKNGEDFQYDYAVRLLKR
jgi:carboxyl-terminal processing protease